MKIEALDHLVLTVADIEHTCDFYQRVLGMLAARFGEGRRALCFGTQKINLHRHHQEFEPKAERPPPGSADICLLAEAGSEEVLAHLRACGGWYLRVPEQRKGARGPIESVYFRDPDGNLIEVSRYLG